MSIAVRPPGASSGPSARVGTLGAAAVAGQYADELVLGTVRDVHRAVARRAFGVTNRATGGAARVPQRLHNGIAGGVYAGVGATLKGATAALRAADRRGLGGRLDARPGGRHLVAALNGLVGDRLAEDRSALAITMAVRHRGSDVPLQPAALEAAFPHATGDLVVFLHGLVENEEWWDRRAENSGGSYGSRLAQETSWTPVYLRANTGLPIADNGAALARLLDRLVAAWPVEVRRIALVGHSMGGLVMRAACAVATEPETGWPALVSDVVTLGSPHLGAPLERAVHAGARVLGLLPEAAPFGRILEYRSVGILDLRHGLAADVRHLPHARYHLVAATLGASYRHPVSEALGDLLVRYPSAVGRPRRGPAMFPAADVLHVPTADHFDLLNHPDVYRALRRWLTEPPPKEIR